MTISIKPFAVLASAALLMTSGVAFAQTQGGPPQGGQGGSTGPGMMGGGHGPGRPQMMGSSTWQRPPMGSSTWQGGEGGHMGSTTGMMPHGVPGLVTSVGTNSFTMDTRGLDKQSTTTFTVTVTDSTKYFKGPMGIGEGMKTGWSKQGEGSEGQQGQSGQGEHMRGASTSAESASGTPERSQGRPNFLEKLKSFFNFFGGKNKGNQGAAVGSAMGMPQSGQQGGQGSQMGTPATFADVTVGAHVEVIGKVATSTKTITAERVIIAGARPTKTGSDSNEGGDTPPTSPQGNDEDGGQMNNGGPGAAVWNFLFGWFH